MKKRTHCIWITVVFLLFFTLFRMAEPRGWDEAFYMSQLSSAALDRDLMLQNDLLHYGLPLKEKVRALRIFTKDHHHLNAFSAGPALFYSVPVLPVYAAGAERFGIGFQRAAALWTALFWILAMICLFRILTLLSFGESVRYPAILTAVFSTPMIYYGMRFYLSGHFTSTVTTVFVIAFWMMWLRNPSRITAWSAGLASGLLVISRWQTAVLFLAFCIPVMQSLQLRETRRLRIQGLLIAVAAAGVLVAVQMTAWKLQLGQWICMPQGRGFVDFSKPAVGRFLISGFHGLIPYAPGLLIGWIGLLLKPPGGMPREYRWLFPGLAVVMVIQVYVSASVWDWWGGAAFGPRRMCFLLTPAAIGWAQILRRLKGIPRALLPLLMIAWALVTLSAYRVHLDDLTLLFTGSPDPFRPHENPVTDVERGPRFEQWLDGFQRMIKPGFTLYNRPRPPHRRAGLAILGGMLILAAGLVRLLDRHVPLRFWVCLCVTGYVLAVVVCLNAGIPPNTPWKEHWYAVAKHQPEPPLPREPFPAEYETAMKLMKTVHNIQSSSERDILDEEQTCYSSFPGITIQSLMEVFSKRSL